jgi:glutamate--cysteine ligase
MINEIFTSTAYDPSLYNTVPHLTTALPGPLKPLESHFLTKLPKIELWFRQQWHLTPAPFYASVDLRNAGFKLAPVDTNLFPAGFNNLNSALLPLCVQAIQSAIERLKITATRILLIPENHTRNLYYLESLATLRDILQKAGYEVRIGSLLSDLVEPNLLTLPSGQNLLLEPVIRENDYLRVQNFLPCLILLNNDLSLGTPPLLEGLSQKIIPPVQMGWSYRLKSAHFTHYSRVAKEFSKQINLDPWLIDPLFSNCGEIDFMNKAGEECLADNIQGLLAAIQEKYNEYSIPHPPFVIIKADAGSYGMGVMTVHSPDEIRNLNRKQRTRMSATKEGQKIRQVILQEGVYTFETVGSNQAVAEPVVYLIDHFVVGGFYRVHTARGINENLNAPGMHFEPLAFAKSCITPEKSMAPDACPNRFYAYGVIARLALIAAAREIGQIATGS